MKNTSSLNIALVGASGAVGTEFLKLFELRNFPVKNLKLLSSARSAGKSISFKGKKIALENLNDKSFKNIDLAFFAAGAERSLDFVPKAVASGALVIDNSSAFRLDETVPLIVPSCNMQEAKKNQGIIANPNCSTIQMVEALKPIHDFAGINRVVVSTYQAVSGSGVKAIQELNQQIHDYAAGKEITAQAYPLPILMNAIPQVDKFVAGGYTKEEMKMVFETRKILNIPEMKITATCVRLPYLEIEIRNSLETTQEYFFWYPKFQEKESNNNLLSYNPINANSKVFATLNGRGDKDFYSISTKNKKKWSLEIIILNKSNLKPVLLLFDKDANLIQKIALDKVKKRLVFHVSFPKSHNLGFIEIADDTVSGASFLNKIVTANYIFSVF